WDVDESEIFEVVDKTKDSIAREEKFNIFVDWFTKPKVVNMDNFDEEMCRELGGIWEEGFSGRGSCTLLGLKDVLPFDSKVVEVDIGYPEPIKEIVTDFSKEGILRLGLDYSLPFNVRVEDVVRFSAHDAEISAFMKEFPHLAIYFRNRKKVVIRNCEEYMGGREVKGLCVSVLDMDDEDREKYSNMIEKIDKHIRMEEPFELEEVV
ncbi:MAG: hypothetical protein ACXQS2_02200, partial [Methermicoccaceae archaeon]